MPDFAALLQQGAGQAWLFVPSAILLGALHGLEPGHSKTMMAAFIVAIRGSVLQAVLLGLAATVSHTLVVWVVALVGLRLGQGWDAATTEPYLLFLDSDEKVAIAGSADEVMATPTFARRYGAVLEDVATPRSVKPPPASPRAPLVGT